MAALENILDEVFVRSFLIQENYSYEELFDVIKNRFPNLKGRSLRSVKRYCSDHGIKKRATVSEIRLPDQNKTSQCLLYESYKNSSNISFPSIYTVNKA